MNEASRDIKMYLLHIIDAIEFYDRMSYVHNCNDCGGKEKGCIYLPDWGDNVWWNCPHWKEKEG